MDKDIPILHNDFAIQTPKRSVLVLIWWCFLNSATRCNCDLQDTNIKLSVTNRHNNTGHLLSQVALETDPEQTEQKPRSWKIEINQDTACGCTCSGKHKEPPRPHYELFPGLGYYKLHNQQKTWNEAKLTCQKEGAHLAVINSRDEVEVFRYLRDRLPKIHGDARDDFVFIGMTDIKEEGKWVTIFDEPQTEMGFNLWDEGEPGNGRGENCGLLRVSTGKFHDGSCPGLLGFCCELEL
ncbi:hemolymph lipopolysaccharide-binding protein-like [Periplaneta americana]|uniref:hemolymph lipopolysaccharide-binding protein-like n=1 Tax=Periplaneta americana TaxID=6978 RepID=UPI0037E7BEAB